MNRREFLKKTISDSARVTTGVALGVVSTGKEAGSKSIAHINRKVKAIGDRIDKMEAQQRRLIKAGLIFAGISTGIDLSILM